jgi:hypothetical protein
VADRLTIRGDTAPALGDIRALRPGAWVDIYPTARERADWPRYIDALASAMAHGVSVRWVRP